MNIAKPFFKEKVNNIRKQSLENRPEFQQNGRSMK